MYRIELLMTHTHANEVHFAGDVIHVDEITARWIVEKGIGKPVETSQTLPETTASTLVAPEAKTKRKLKE